MRICFIIITLFFGGELWATAYFVSDSEGDDTNNGLSVLSPFQSIQQLNGMSFVAGDSILFHSGGYWEGMFWIHGDGTFEEPIVVGSYGGDVRPVINGFGYQSWILIYNTEHIKVEDIVLLNQASHLD